MLGGGAGVLRTSPFSNKSALGYRIARMPDPPGGARLMVMNVTQGDDR
jgi:hypothetical protein